MGKLLTIVSIAIFIFIVQLAFLIYKSRFAFLILQQSAYDNKRFFRYLTSHYKNVFGINEMLVLFGVYITFNLDYIIGLLFISVILYYNTRFFNMSESRFISKVKLNVTTRVKRQISLYMILNLSVLLLAYIYGINLYVTFILITYFCFPMILIVNTLLQPIEYLIKEHYKKKAITKLKLHQDILVIGITGSYGKTTIKNIVGTILESKEPTLITPESFNTPMGLTITINDYLNVFHKNFIAEMGAYYPGEIKELCDMVHPKVGVVSNVGNQHLETFKNIQTILKTKMELIEALPLDGLGILNYDNEYIRNYKIKNKVPIKYYSLTNKTTDIYASNITYNGREMHFKITYMDQEFDVKSKLLGTHNVENILAGILVGIYKGFDIKDILNAIEEVNPIAHRLEYKKIDENLIILDDSFNSNTQGIIEAIKILGQSEIPRKFIITPGLIDLGDDTKDFHISLGTQMTNYATDIIIIGSLNEKNIRSGIEKTNFLKQNVHYFDNFIQGYNYSIAVKEKKVILIANDLPDKFNN